MSVFWRSGRAIQVAQPCPYKRNPGKSVAVTEKKFNPNMLEIEYIKQNEVEKNVKTSVVFPTLVQDTN